MGFVTLHLRKFNLKRFPTLLRHHTPNPLYVAWWTQCPCLSSTVTCNTTPGPRPGLILSTLQSWCTHSNYTAGRRGRWEGEGSAAVPQGGWRGPCPSWGWERGAKDRLRDNHGEKGAGQTLLGLFTHLALLTQEMPFFSTSGLFKPRKTWFGLEEKI